MHKREDNIIFFQDRPSSPPTILECKMVNASAVSILWNGPDPDEHNGPLLGYQVRLFKNYIS